MTLTEEERHDVVIQATKDELSKLFSVMRQNGGGMEARTRFMNAVTTLRADLTFADDVLRRTFVVEPPGTQPGGDDHG